jgi:hypothetical protein
MNSGFGAPVTVDGRSADQIDPLIERRMNRANGFFLVGPPHIQPLMAQVPSAIRELLRDVPPTLMRSMLSFS